MTRKDTGATTFSCDPNTGGSKKEPLKDEAAAVASKMKGVSAPADARARGERSRVEPDAPDCVVSVSVPSWTTSSCSVLAFPSCTAGQGEQRERGCSELLLPDLHHLVHIPTRLPKLDSLCTAKTFLLGFNLPLLLFYATYRVKGMKLETNPEVRRDSLLCESLVSEGLCCLSGQQLFLGRKKFLF